MNEKKQKKIPTNDKKRAPATPKTRSTTGKKQRSSTRKNPKGTIMNMSESDLSAYVSQSVSTKKRVSKEEIRR